MSIPFACFSCQSKIRVKDEWKGRQIRCKTCGHRMVIPLVPLVNADAEPITLDWKDIESDAQEESENSVHQSAGTAEPITLDWKDMEPGPQGESENLFDQSSGAAKPIVVQVSFDEIANSSSSAPTIGSKDHLTSAATGHAYRLARLIIGGVLMFGCTGLVIASLRMPWTYVTSAGRTARSRTKTFAMLIALIVGTIAWKLMTSRMTARELRTPFLSNLSRAQRRGYPLSAASFLVIWLLGIGPLTALAAFAIGCVGYGTIVAGLLNIFKDANKSKDTGTIGIDYIVIGLPPAIAVSWHWYSYLTGPWLRGMGPG